jgi:hypothetical protein
MSTTFASTFGNDRMTGKKPAPDVGAFSLTGKKPPPQKKKVVVPMEDQPDADQRYGAYCSRTTCAAFTWEVEGGVMLPACNH